MTNNDVAILAQTIVGKRITQIMLYRAGSTSRDTSIKGDVLGIELSDGNTLGVPLDKKQPLFWITR
jgi:hypothetical protein